MQINTQAERSMDVPLDATKSAWAVEPLDEAWALEC